MMASTEPIQLPMVLNTELSMATKTATCSGATSRARPTPKPSNKSTVVTMLINQ